MTTWIRALCTRSLDAVTADELRAGIAARLPTLATYYGEPDHEEIVARLRVEAMAEGGGYRIHYRADDLLLSARRITRRGDLRAEAEARLADLADCEEDDVDDVRDLLGDLAEVVRFEMVDEHVSGIGWPVAIAAAATLAERGDGVIQADGEGWMEPSGLGVEQVLEGD